ncbi:MAG: 30S ribosomal protein S9 [Deltaproteobacteria bacterium CG11_big_fil_rev_8_21_14_0_20_47_16]|nr:MAG: 30S ribosomal protein S9 [Deltaproteobacteria bacterium CG11_big_fil_rev_8_21_14_0_20_47_16]
MAASTIYAATGKRKSAIARVRIKPGSGEIIVNKRALEDYFGRATLQMKIRQPFEVTGDLNKYDVSVNVIGGGLAGQADAVKHGISRALLEVSADNRKKLKPEGLLTRDSRIKERKKYGRKKARKRFQYSKR